MHRNDSTSADSSPRFKGGWMRFWFTATDPIALHGLRIFIGLTILCWLLSFLGYQKSLFGLGGWLDRTAFEELYRLPEENRGPIAQWSLLYLPRSAVLFDIFYAGSLVVTLLFILGIWTRLTSVGTWLVVMGFTSNPLYVYFGGDSLLIVFSLYLMVGYLFLGLWSREWSWRSEILGDSIPQLLFEEARVPEKSVAANVAVRLMQLHLALIILTNGLHKLQTDTWWSGLALWFPLHPPLETTVSSALDIGVSPDTYLLVLSLAAYAVLAWEISFPFLIWRDGWRTVMLVAAGLAWLGNWLVYRLPLFGPMIFLGSLAFVPPASWHRALAFVAGLPGLDRLQRPIRQPHPRTTEAISEGS